MAFEEFFTRHMALPGFTAEGQQRLHETRLLIVGCGGLGTLFAMQMAASGLRHLYLCDADVVESSNLHRQPAYGQKDIGQPKASILAAFLSLRYPWVKPEVLAMRMHAEQALEWIAKVDMVADCTDHMPTRFLLSDVCYDLSKPLIYGAVHGMEGQVALFCADADRIHLRDIFPAMPLGARLPTCRESGVLGPIAGGVSSRMATEAIKFLTGLGKPLIAQLLHMDWGDNTEYLTRLRANPLNARRIQRNTAAKEFMALDDTNSIPSSTDFTQTETFELRAHQVDESLSDIEIEWVDIREKKEFEGYRLCDKHIPLNELAERIHELSTDKIPVFYCYAGVRSYHAMMYVADLRKWRRIGHLAGGIVDYARRHQAEALERIVH
jgi:sulfur-carrier protein adenylyltransferase/sulfurtransferase